MRWPANQIWLLAVALVGLIAAIVVLLASGLL
jgi:hypothetical protein